MNKKIVLAYIVLLIIPIILLYVFRGNVRELHLIDYIESNELQFSVDEFLIEENILYIQGWLIYPGDSQANGKYNKSVWLQSNNGDMHALKTDGCERYDIANNYGYEVNYENCGFYSAVSCDEIKKHGNHFKVYLCYSFNEKNYIIYTGIEFNLE